MRGSASRGSARAKSAPPTISVCRDCVTARIDAPNAKVNAMGKTASAKKAAAKPVANAPVKKAPAKKAVVKRAAARKTASA